MTRQERLLAELETYSGADAAEERNRLEMVKLLTKQDAFSRAHFAPGHFTASCYIVDGEGRMLLHHHRRLDRWLQMVGHVEGDEAPHDAALRRIRHRIIGQGRREPDGDRPGRPSSRNPPSARR